MRTRTATIKQADAKRLMKAAREAGFERATLTTYPDGRIEIVGEAGSASAADAPLSPFEAWKVGNASKN